MKWYTGRVVEHLEQEEEHITAHLDALSIGDELYFASAVNMFW